ncbi:type I restriction endonuclease subunit R [Paucibacter sp. XJ19-41]|uniref:type I restriction endonuclease subunit R n=1 Tax=Paucibacter sp. XJ19-41 TaxID=2927824 RepID=UPI002348F968|nr:DEAD/DEAH box helicase family protein [Paucibacter sp. XJ19-41]MDC6166994.1 type I restriction-modification enzyme R subunit C-terminal domain-containing protein [Paucibacter sp. XJ19-41]
MSPEQKARLVIDTKLAQAGWMVQDYRALDLSAGLGVAVREHPTDTGPADYLLYVDREPVGVIEAKRDEAGENLTATERQTEGYASAKLKWRREHKPLPFLFESTGQIIRFSNALDPAPRSREIFHFFRPEQLQQWATRPDSLRRRLAEHMPALPSENLRDCQTDAVIGLEQSLGANRPRALVHMATGAGKTFTAITAIYRLLKFGGAKRILFLVDTRNLGKQAHQEFMAYTPPDDGRKFTELYNVQRVGTAGVDRHAHVCISTIQRMYATLSGEPLDESTEDIPAEDVAKAVGKQGKLVQYNAELPVEAFDFIVIDECHRSIYNLWKQVLDYFDAFLIGLTATPDKRTFGFFNENVVAEYSYEDSVADGVNVGYDVWEIDTEVTKKGGLLEAKEWVDHRDRQTRKKRWAETEEDTAYTGKQLDRSVVNTSQIRLCLQAMKTAVETQLFPNRQETPKTLIFAKTDSHADDIIKLVREVYDQGNAFCRKVTYSEKDADGVLQAFRNEYHPRIAVTVDMIATGTDVKPLEVLLFMRDVRSKGYYEQMKGRGVRSLDADGLQRVSASADGAKTRFVLIDAVGVEKSLKTESRPLEKKPQVPLKELLQGVALGQRDDDTLLSLANRLVRLAKQLDDKARTRIESASGGVPVAELGKTLIQALNPDAIVEAALTSAKAQGFTRSEDTLLPEELKAAREARVRSACAPFDKPALRDEIETARRDREQLIDHVNLDKVNFSGFAAQAEAQAREAVQRFEDYLREHQDEIAALGFYYQQPYQCRPLVFEALDQLTEQLARPPLMLTTDKLWSAYARVKANQVKGATLRRQLTDIVSLLRFATGMDTELKPFADSVDKRFQAWIFRHNAQRGSSFSPEQTEWLRLMKDHIASSCAIGRDDFDYAELAAKGGLQRAWAVFGPELDELMSEMNVELVA